MPKNNKVIAPKEKVYFRLQWTEKTQIAITAKRLRFIVACLIVLWPILFLTVPYISKPLYDLAVIISLNLGIPTTYLFILLLCLPIIVGCLVYTNLQFTKADNKAYRLVRLTFVTIQALVVSFIIIFFTIYLFAFLNTR